MLRQLLPIAAERGLKRVLITCTDGNIGSEKIIRHNGGVYEKSVTVDGEEIYFIPNPALGLWINREAFK